MSKEAKEFLLKPESAKLSISQIMQSFADEQNKKEKQRHALEELTQTSTIDELVEKVKKLEGENKELKQQLEDANKLLTEIHHLHLCEQEGIGSGQPSPNEWFDAVNKISDYLNQSK